MSSSQVLGRSPTAILSAAQVQVRDLLARYATLGQEESREKSRLFCKIRQELLILLEVEESLFYPTVQDLDVESSNQAVVKAQMDHRVVKAFLKSLTDLSSENTSLDPMMDALLQCVLRHFELEQSRIFPPSRTLSQEALQKMSVRMETLGGRLRMNQEREQQAERDRNRFYPTLQDKNGAPEDDRDTPLSLESPGDLNERHPSDFENWGSE